MVLHATSVFDKVSEWSPEKSTSKALLSASQEWK